MSGEPPDEYELVDLPEPEAPEPPKPAPPGAPGQPLPRLWRTEPDEVEPAPVAEPPRSKPEPAPRRRPKPARGAAVSKPKAEPGEKKGLIEATPALDTHEARQRGRLLVGALILAIAAIGMHLVYQTLIYDPFPMDDTPSADDVVQAPIEPSLPRLAPDAEAQTMLRHARDAAKAGQTDAAVALLERLVTTYKNTPAAGEARAALERPARNLPLFLDRPTVEAEAPPPAAPAPPPEPPAVVVARTPNAPVQGEAEAELAPPVNPAEPIVSPPTVTASVAAAEVPERTLPPGFAARPEAGVDPSGWPLMIVGDRDGAPMVFVPGGVFTVGDDQDQQFAAPAHKVRLSAYYIDQHEVTARQFHLFLSETNHRGKPPGNWPPIAEAERAAAEPSPMVMVNVDDARAYAEWAGKHLPTEAQWEAAARSSDGRAYPWGNTQPSYARPRAPRQIDPVMTFPEDRSPYGVFDLAGNAQEWTADLFDPGYYRSIAGRIVDDPTGARPRAGRSDQVVKGGKMGAAAAREPISPEKRLNYVGFRCALQVERPAVAPDPEPIAVPEPPRGPVRTRRPVVQPGPTAPF